MTTETNTDAVRVTDSWRVAIQATYHGPTNSRGTRIRVRRMDEKDPNAITVGWDHSKNIGDNYAAAIEEYARRMNWGGHWIVGTYNGGAVATWAGWCE